MADTTYVRRQSSSVRANGRAGAVWLVQAFSGLLLVALLGLHMIAHHFVVEGGLRNFQQVVAYVSNPAIFVTTIVFLIVATIHALLGLRAIIVDLGPSPGTVRLVNWLFAIVGVAAIVYGIWLEVVIISYGA
jgi:succinate dehydrogenase hydrophobic anchor subunit